MNKTLDRVAVRVLRLFVRPETVECSCGCPRHVVLTATPLLAWIAVASLALPLLPWMCR